MPTVSNLASNLAIEASPADEYRRCVKSSGLALCVVMVIWGRANAAPDPNDPLIDGALQPPRPETAAPANSSALPAIPTFELPPINADGSHAVRALRVEGRRSLGTTVTVRGVVTWVYDCATAARKRGETVASVQQRIDADPTICERAKFYLGDRKDTPPERSVWVVDVPRPWNKLERERIAKADRVRTDRCEPGEPDRTKQCPPLKVGDELEVTGTWTLTSPHSERNSDGLLVYASLQNLTQGWASPGFTVHRTPAPPPPPPPAAPRPLPTTAPAPRKVPQRVFLESMQRSNAGVKAYALKQWDTAIGLFSQAIARWPAHHQALYGLAAAHAQRREWAAAATAGCKAVELQPDVAMYHLFCGRYLYEEAIASAKQAQARAQNKQVEDIEVDLSKVSFDTPRAHLATALALNNGLWRAHYLLGSIERAGGRWKAAATAFSQAVALGATEPAPWVAIAELYRLWDHPDEAIAIAELGTRVITDADGVSALWFEVGMGYDDKRATAKAIVAFDNAIDARRDNHLARFARGQANFRVGNREQAKRDLETFAKTAGAPDFYLQQATRMLLELDAKPR
jgi:tetratricopeptide (TPR) repeat protein